MEVFLPHVKKPHVDPLSITCGAFKQCVCLGPTPEILTQQGDLVPAGVFIFKGSPVILSHNQALEPPICSSGYSFGIASQQFEKAFLGLFCLWLVLQC